MNKFATAVCSRCGPERQVLTFGPGYFGCVQCGRGYGRFTEDNPHQRTLEAVQEWNENETPHEVQDG